MVSEPFNTGNKKMKQFLKTICIGNFYLYQIFKITDSVGRVYYIAEPLACGATRIGETEQELLNILNHDYQTIVKQQQRIR